MSELKVISKELQAKILKYAVAIISEHGSIAGDRCCQDWSIDPDEIEPPESAFSNKEKQAIAFNYQQFNSSGRDYDPNFLSFHDFGNSNRAAISSWYRWR